MHAALPAPATARPPRALRARGFTLLELLVAVTILAVVAVMAWRGLSSLTATRERLAPQNEDVHALLAALGQLERDLAQAPGSVQLFALPAPPVRVLTVDGRLTLEILRLAEAPDGSRTTAVQRVVYRVHDGALLRQSGPAQRFYQADMPVDAAGVRLVPKVDELQIRVWRNAVGWITPVSDSDTANAPGIELRLLRHDGSSIRRVLMVG